MKTDNKKFARDYAEIIRLADKEMFSRGKAEVKRALKNNLGFDYDILSILSIEDFAAFFDTNTDAETFYLAGEVLVIADAIERATDSSYSNTILEKALYLFLQALAVEDGKIRFVAERSLCAITSRIDVYSLPEFLFTKLEVQNIECSAIITVDEKSEVH